MKKLSALFIVLALLMVGKTFAQPQITVHVTGGYNLPLPDLKGEYPADTNSLLQKSGFNAGADVKYFLGKKRNVGVTLSGAYNSFSSGDIAVTGGNFVSKVNIITIGLGIEYAFQPKAKANPFIGLEFTGNFFGGKTTVTPTGGTASEFTLKSASRFGVAGNLGVDVNLNKNIGFVVGAKYNMANLIGKDSATTTTTNEYTLVDKETAVTKSKNLSYLSVYAGISFYFNRPKTTTRK